MKNWKNQTMKKEIKNSDEVTMLARNERNDGGDNVNIDVFLGRSEVESEEKDQSKISIWVF